MLLNRERNVIKIPSKEREFSANDEVRDNEGNIIISKNLKIEDWLKNINTYSQ